MFWYWWRSTPTSAHLNSLWPGVQMGHRSEWEKRLDAVWQQAALQSGCLPSWGKYGILHSAWQNAVSHPVLCIFLVLCIAFQFWVGPLSRELFVLHTSGSAVEGMAVLCTISLRDKLSAIHWGNYVSKHTRQSQCYTEQSLKTLMEWLVAS